MVFLTALVLGAFVAGALIGSGHSLAISALAGFVFPVSGLIFILMNHKQKE